MLHRERGHPAHKESPASKGAKSSGHCGVRGGSKVAEEVPSQEGIGTIWDYKEIMSDSIFA